ncbi:tyrosine-protein phosphatase 69D [Caerostris darwini]|uniref:Tyrosine-protein phosphatase 69D n=1 Tax=Caerostris darwini TaxID=1538125 RepID=A0AAV4MAP3_9ARAC|nr:tyrosine-protein phosphatase 69D [Caerostris darwini]
MSSPVQQRKLHRCRRVRFLKFISVARISGNGILIFADERTIAPSHRRRRRHSIAFCRGRGQRFRFDTRHYRSYFNLPYRPIPSSHLSKLPYFGPITAEELPAVYAEKHLDTDLLFRSEFEALPDVFRDRTTTASDCIDNICKNRYPEIKATAQEKKGSSTNRAKHRKNLTSRQRKAPEIGASFYSNPQ